MRTVQTQMARRRFRSNQRHEPSTERSVLEYFSTPAPQTSRTEIMRLVRGGEDTYLELKVKLSNSEKIAQGIVALANTGGGVIVFGVDDQMRVEGLSDPESVQEELVRICRHEIAPMLVPYVDGISFDNGRRIVALEVRGTRRPYRTRADGRYFVRMGAEKREAMLEELTALMDEARPFQYECAPVIGASVKDVDEAHLWSYLREFEGDAFTEASFGDYPTAEVLERELALATTQGGETVPTIAGLLLFGRDESVHKLLPRASLTAVRFSGDSSSSGAPEIERAQLTGNLHTVYEATLRFIRRYCDLWEARPRSFAHEEQKTDETFVARANYQRDAVCEAVANALSHRDLALRDHTTRIHIYDHSIEIINPRRAADFASTWGKAIRYGVPQRLNPQLHAVFINHAYGIKLPHGGLPMLMRQSRLFSSRRPEIHVFNDEFRLRIYGS